MVLVLKTLALGAATVGKGFVVLGKAIGAGVAAAVQALRGNTAGALALIAELKGSLVRRLDELAAFRDSLFDPKPIEVRAPRIQADPDLLQRLARPTPAQDSTGAQTALIKAQLDAEFALLKDGLTRQQAALDAALQDRLISLRDYHARKTVLEQQALDAEIARKQQELARSRQVAAGASNENERLRARGEVARLVAKLIVLNNRRADIEQANLAKLEQEWRLVTKRLRNAQKAIQNQSQAGLLTEAQAR